MYKLEILFIQKKVMNTRGERAKNFMRMDLSKHQNELRKVGQILYSALVYGLKEIQVLIRISLKFVDSVH